MLMESCTAKFLEQLGGMGHCVKCFFRDRKKMATISLPDPVLEASHGQQLEEGLVVTFHAENPTG